MGFIGSVETKKSSLNPEPPKPKTLNPRPFQAKGLGELRLRESFELKTIGASDFPSPGIGEQNHTSYINWA